MSSHLREDSSTPFGTLAATTYGPDSPISRGARAGDLEDKQLPGSGAAVPDVYILKEDGKHEFSAAAILKGDVIRHMTVFEKKAALINS